MIRKALVVFARTPVAGKVKTRLAATVGSARALSVYRQLMHITRNAVANLNCEKFLFYTDGVPETGSWPGFTLVEQAGSDLGERMFDAFDKLVRYGIDNTVIIGTDCPGIDKSIIEMAFDHLSEADLVIGPATDGGYYLIAAKKLHKDLFENIPWSSASVFQETLRRAQKLSLRYVLLPLLPDIDEEKDLVYLHTQEEL